LLDVTLTISRDETISDDLSGVIPPQDPSALSVSLAAWLWNASQLIIQVIREFPSLLYFCHVLMQFPSAHAALSPWEGKNALDAAVLGYTAISALRQQIRPTHRVHGIFEGRDWAPNSKLL
jgi:hypothetical protein